MGINSTTDSPLPFEACKRIMAVLPDDGTDHRLIRALRLDRGITRVDSVSVRAVAMLQEAKTRKGRLPESVMAKVLTAIVDESEADAVFDYIYQAANIGHPGGGMLVMNRLLGTTPYMLPEGMPDEV